MPTIVPLESAGVFRRLAAAVYDLLLVLAIWMLIALIVVVLSGGEAVPAGHPAFQLSLLASSALFFMGSWLRGGQTLGMRAWRLQVRMRYGGALDRRAAMLRFAGGMLSVMTGGLGLLWAWIDRDQLSWHDRLSGTHVVILAKLAA